MPLPTVNDVQAVDPVLTNMLVEYMQSDNRFVASRVFPPVSVEKDSGTYYIATKKYFFLDDLARRAPGDEYESGNFGVSTSTYTTQQWAKQIPLADETVANSQVPGDLEELAVRRLAQASLIRKERQFATDFMANSVWGTTDNNSTTDWDDFSAGDPVNDALTARRTISNATGSAPNVLVVGHIVHNALVNHPDVIDRIKHTEAATVGNIEDAIASVMGVERYLPSLASYNSANEGASFSGSAIIDDDALFCVVDDSAGFMGATAGKTFYWNPGGGLGAIARNRSDERDSNMVKHKEQWDQVAVATDMGYIFLDVV